ncbi:MAG: MFS transporter, partial [Pseudonocardiaceae bacterium]
GAFVALYNAAAFRLTGEPLNLAPAVASLVFLAYAMGAVSSSLAGWLVGRFGRVTALLGALVVTGLGAMVTLSDRLPMVVAGFVVLTGGFFAAHAVSSGWTAGAAEPGGRGQASGLYTLAYYLGSSIGGTVGSVVFAHAGWGALIGMVAAWLVLAMLAVVAVRRHG